MKKNRIDKKPRRAKEREARRTDIVTAAERIFLRKGYTGASMDEIAAEAEFTKRTVYMYFTGKEDLLFAVALEGSKRLFAEQQRAIFGGDPGLEKIRRAALAYYEFSRDLPELYRIIEDARRLKPRPKESPARGEFVRYRMAMFEAYERALRAGIADGSIRGDLDPQILVAAVVLSLTGFFKSLSEAVPPGPLGFDPDTLARSTVELLIDALRPRPRAKDALDP